MDFWPIPARGNQCSVLIDRQGHAGKKFCQRDGPGKGVTADRKGYSALPPLLARADGVPEDAADTA